jgi:hypothetical protein
MRRLSESVRPVPLGRPLGLPERREGSARTPGRGPSTPRVGESYPVCATRP